MFNYVTELRRKLNLNDIKVFGFVDYVHSLINISDVVNTKCGASTFMEILLMGKVPIINNYIWEQEKGNMEFICNGNMGIMEKNIKLIPSVISRLLNDNDFYESLSGNIKKASLRNGVGPVSDYILKLN